MKMRFASLLTVLAMLVCALGGAAFAESEGDLLARIAGTYDEFFAVACAPEYDQVWLDACAEFGGEENAEAFAQLLKEMCVGELYGEAAVAAYAGAEEMQFNCSFIGGVAQMTFAEGEISGTDAGGESVFAHAYSYVGVDEATGFAIYQSADAGSGEFTYFLLAPDTPAQTYHIEFRYGSDLEALGQLMEGPYAYWLAAGIPVEDQEAYVVNAVRLFCEENLAELAA